jgi:hypothetical protein
MKPNISEFSYGYAVTEELIHWNSTPITAAPVFPSLYSEGQKGGGWDLKLSRPGIPLFIQFKLSDFMVRSTAQECQDGLFTIPFFRMHLRPSRHSQQHEMLLDLENNGNEVYYAAPAFHEPDELNEAYLSHQITTNSIWVRPSWIGQLPNDKDHHIAFQHPGSKHFCSESFRMKEKADFDSFTDVIHTAIRERGKIELSKERLNEIADSLTDISRKRMDINEDSYQFTRLEMQSRHPIERIAFYSYIFLDAQMFIVNETETTN